MYRKAHILSNGSVGVCSCRDIESEIVIGDISKESIKDIWLGEKLKKYRSQWSTKMPNVCVNCDRYKPIDEFISKQAFSIFSTHLKRIKRRILQ